MKKRSLLLLGTIFFLSFLFPRELEARKSSPCIKAPAAKENIFLQLPPVIYAVPGVESNIYFDNVVLTPNPASFIFDVKCAKGKNFEKRWSFIPEDNDVGTFPLELKVLSTSGVIAHGKTKVIVSPKDAGKGKAFSMLHLGDSLSHAGVFPQKFRLMLKRNGNPDADHIGLLREPNNGLRHEGYSGWRWDTFLNKKKPTPLRKGQRRGHHYNASPFWINGRFSIKEYLKRENKGKAPDFIFFQLGVNDVFSATDEDLDQRIEKILANADKLISAFRKEAPNAIIGIGLVTPGAASQDAFGNCYNCGQTRWQYKKNQHTLNAAMLKKYHNGPDKKIFIIPVNVNLDCENNFSFREEAVNSGNKKKIRRMNNGVHPNPAGYCQMGESYYCFIRYILNGK